MNLNIQEGKLWKKYRLHCNYCGADTYKTLWILKLILIFQDHYVHHCGVCHHTNYYLNQFHLVHDSTHHTEKEYNKERRWDDRIH
jgi:hypothetical protein